MRSIVVVDTSIVIKWVLNEPDSAMALALLNEWSSNGTAIRAPALLIYELTNALYQHIRKNDETLEEAKQALVDAFLVNLELDFSLNIALSMRAMEFAHQHKLPATYDPHYLALAERENCEYWTADKRLWNAVKGKLTWVRWFGDYQSIM
jgi:predicted nucleic acid-binding protein